MFPARFVDYRRHFPALAAAVAVLAPTAAWRATLTTAEAFGLFGALHACAIVVSLRGRPRPLRSIAFIALAGLLTMGIVRAGLHASSLRGTLPGPAGRTAILAMCSGLGAMGYGGLIRAFWSSELTAPAIIALAAGCMAMTSVVQLTAGILHRFDPAWLAVAWWCAFSVTLCLQARHSARAATAGSVDKLR